jgi:catechol 2,3-dioxygenase-like lactoylglutathione lyase family enzyme
MQLNQLDHLVLTVADVNRTVRFYVDILGMREESFGANRWALIFGRQKINLHKHGAEYEPKAHTPTPGSADLCFLTSTPVAQIVAELKTKNVTIENGPVDRIGASGKIRSIYLRDPDRNLIEIANQVG